MSEKFLNSRIIHKHDIESNWNKATNFIPKQGELIIYDIDDTHDYERIKIGDGTTNVNDLPFYAGSWDDLKNRPFGTTESVEELLSENTYVTTDDVQTVCSFNTDIVAGDTYIVTHNGTEYKIVASSAFLGDKRPFLLWDISGGYEYPFFIQNGFGVNVFGAGTHTIKIEHVAEDVQQIDSKFIPSDKFMVTFLANVYPVECDKTYDEIVEAHRAGKDIIGRLFDSYIWNTSTYIYNANTDVITFYFEVSISTGILTKAWSIDSSNTITEQSYNSIEIDSGLTISGQAADAKATGDAISDLSALVGDTSVSEQINNAFKNNQADYNQNDSTAADYIKNRPFYTGDPVETVVVEESTVEFVEDSGGIYAAEWPASFEAVEGQTYIVKFDGTSYNCVAQIFNGEILALGNMSLAGSDDDTGEPFLLMHPDAWIIVTTDTSASHVLSITHLAQEIKQIDKQYLPKASYFTKGIISWQDFYPENDALVVYPNHIGSLTLGEVLTQLRSHLFPRVNIATTTPIQTQLKFCCADWYTAVTDTKIILYLRSLNEETSLYVSLYFTRVEDDINSGVLTSINGVYPRLCGSGTDVGSFVSIYPTADKLQFNINSSEAQIVATEDYVSGQITEFVGEAPVATQISTAVSTKADIANGQYAVTAASTDGVAYTATVPSITELTAGVSFIMIPGTISTSISPTLDVNGLGAKYIRRRLSTMATAVQTGSSASWLAANLPFRVVYDPTGTGCWIVEGQVKPAASDLYGTVASATKATQDGSGNVITDTYVTKTAWQNALPKCTTISLPAANWTGDSNPWSQVVTISAVTENSKVDLQPTATQIVELQENGIALMTQNDSGTITVYALGSKPTADYTMQVLITETIAV